MEPYRDDFEVEPIGKVLQRTPSGYRRYAARQRHPDLRSPRMLRDEGLRREIQRIWEASRAVYDADKIWRQLNREGFSVARCTVERLMREPRWQGVRRGKQQRTTIPDHPASRPQD